MSEDVKNILEEYKDIKSAIEVLMDMLKENGWELDENGDIIDSKTKKFVLGGNDNE